MRGSTNHREVDKPPGFSAVSGSLPFRRDFERLFRRQEVGIGEAAQLNEETYRG